MKFITAIFLFSFVSVAGGNSWSLIDGPAGEYDIQGIGFESAQHEWVSPRNEGLFETHDGGLKR